MSMTDAQKRIEKSFQRAMDIRDSLQSDITDSEEAEYSEAYLEAYKAGDVSGFKQSTRKYLRALRSFAQACRQLERLGYALQKRDHIGDI